MTNFKSTAILLAALCCLSLLSLANSATVTDHLREYKDTLDKHVKNAAVNELQDLYYKTISLVEHGKENVEKIVSKDTACAALKKIGFKAAVEAGRGSEFIYLYKAFGCPVDELKEEHRELLKTAAKGDKLEDIENALDVATGSKTFGATDVTEACTKVVDLIKDDGTAKSSKRGTDYSYSNTARVLNVLQKCKNFNLVDNKVTQKLDKVTKSLLEGAKSIGRDAKAFLEEDVFGTTSKLIQSISKLSPSALKGQDLSSFASYLRSQKDLLLSPERHYWFNRAAETLKDVPIVELQSNAITKGKDLVLKARLNNLSGEEIKNVTGLKLKGNLYAIGSGDRQSTPVGNEIAFERKADGSYEAKLNEKDLKNDAYQLRLTASQGANVYNYVEELAVKSALKVKSARFSVTKSSDRPDLLENAVGSGETYKTNIPVNQGNYIHVELKVEENSPKVGLVAARLVGKQHKYSTGTVPARYESGAYRLVIDLGDPDHIQPYDGQYELEVVISGESVESLTKWTLARFDVTFVKPAEHAPLQDADIQPLPEISHRFPDPRRKPDFLITTFFSGVAVVAVLVFLTVLLRLGVNLDNLPKSATGKLSSLLFLGAILALLGTIALFWFKINLPTTLILLGLLTFPTIIVGNSALRSLAQERKLE